LEVPVLGTKATVLPTAQAASRRVVAILSMVSKLKMYCAVSVCPSCIYYCSWIRRGFCVSVSGVGVDAKQ
jgi:hypothetical protein